MVCRRVGAWRKTARGEKWDMFSLFLSFPFFLHFPYIQNAAHASEKISTKCTANQQTCHRVPTRKCRCNRFGRGSYTTLHKEFGNCYGRWVRIGKGEDVTNIHTRRRLPSRHELCLYTMSRAHADKVRLSDMCGKIYAAQDLSVDKNRTITRLHYRLDWRNSYVFSYKKNKWGQAACATNSSYAKITCKAAMPGRRRRSNHYRLCDHSDVALQHVFGPDASIQLSITSPRSGI